MKSVERFLGKQKGSQNVLVTPKSQQIRYNIELINLGEDYYFDELKMRMNLFIIYRNPKNLLNKILDQFQKGDFHPILEEDSLINGPSFEGRIPGTVNNYLFKSYLVTGDVSKLNFSFTRLPAILDKNLSENYKKNGSIEKYLRKFIDK